MGKTYELVARVLLGVMFASCPPVDAEMSPP